MMADHERPQACAWDERSLRQPHAQADKAARVEAMFDAIAPTYERVNRLASFGRDAVWRRRAVATADVQKGDVVLDVCCGTGDMVRAFGRAAVMPARIIGVDFAANMLAEGDFRVDGVATETLRADALALPLDDASVNVISCAFGVRNFRDVQAGLNEMARVAATGARLVILEFAAPQNRLLRWLHGVYNDRVLPTLGTWISRDRTGAYRYLPRSIATFEPVETMKRRLRSAGFENVTARQMNFGGVVLYRGVRTAAPQDAGE